MTSSVRLAGDRLTPRTSRRIDRRQPLPATFAVRFREAGFSFDTLVAIWREAVTGAGELCTSYLANRFFFLTESVRFDEHENATILRLNPLPGAPGGIGLPPLRSDRPSARICSPEG